MILNSTADRTIRVGVIALSRFLDDPRVKRQCEVLSGDGYEVFAIGQDDLRQEVVPWTVVHRERSDMDVGQGNRGRFRSASFAERWRLNEPPRKLVRLFFSLPVVVLLRIKPIARVLQRLILVAQAQRCRLQPRYAIEVFWSWRGDYIDLYEKAKHLKCDVWLANDWTALPIAARLTKENGGVYIYDTHEFALQEYQERWLWRISQKPIVAALENSFIHGARFVTAVSSGISDRLTAIYKLSKPVITIRNTPPHTAMPFRPTPPVIRVLYHGIVAPGRGLEAAIDSVSAWSPDRELYIRGPGGAEYVESLTRRIARAGLQRRVSIIPPVPMTELVRAAAEFDIGFFALPGHSLHNQFALPNKFFEYTMAGLALSVSRLPEMELLIKQFELGSTFAEVDPRSIADAINAMSRDDIDRFKRNALKAAETLCWERESEKLLSAIGELAVAGHS
jgi:glycosyltransferase involved in cell wall biosynthesis